MKNQHHAACCAPFKFWNNTTRLLFAFCLTCALSSFATTVKGFAADASPLNNTELQADTSLSYKVSLEAKSKPLREVVADIAKQSGLKLECSDSIPASTLVTMRVNEMPLWSFMASLSRVYGTTWTKTEGGGFVISKDSSTPLQDKIRQVGHPMRYRFNEITTVGRKIQQQELRDLTQEILATSDINVLRFPKGMALADLPDDIVERIRNAYQENCARHILMSYFTMTRSPLPPDAKIQISLQATNPPEPDLEKLFEAPNANANRAPGIKVLTPDATGLLFSMPLIAPTKEDDHEKGD